MPFWWTVTAASLVLFAMGYWMWTVSFAVSPGGFHEYVEARAAALNEGEDASDEDIFALAADPLTVEAGRDTFARNCVQCHGERAQGITGPNLTDNYWIEGGRPAQNYKTIVYGRAGKMPPWGGVLGVGMCKALAAYLETLRGSSEAGKSPEGTEVSLTEEKDTP
jgi:cytochrome c oxidase cbb3-type subunit 3